MVLKFIQNFTFLCVALAIIGCGNNVSTENTNVAEMTDAERHNYNMCKYWQEFNFNDTTWLSHKKELEQVFAVWVEGVLKAYYENDTILSREPIERAMISGPMLSRFMDMADECFRNPISPWRCEELYIPMLETALKSDKASLEDKMRWEDRLSKALMNRQGKTAADIEFETITGVKSNLHSINATYTLLYFFNPGCHDCERVSQVIEDSPVVEALIDCDKLKIVAIYPDEDLGEWNKLPRRTINGWTIGRITDESEREKYDLPAIPNLYLLDKDKTVIIKDGTIEEIIFALQNM